MMTAKTKQAHIRSRVAAEERGAHYVLDQQREITESHLAPAPEAQQYLIITSHIIIGPFINLSYILFPESKKMGWR